MTLTREEADRIAKEAREQGWEGDKHIVDEGTDQEYNEGYGRVDIYDWDEINRRREELGNGSLGGSGYSVELHWPDLLGPEYMIHDTDDWRQLKAKVDEMREIIKQIGERGWTIPSYTHLQKAGKLGMMIEVMPPGERSGVGVRVGGMRTWRKLCREYDDAITIAPETHRLQESQGAPRE